MSLAERLGQHVPLTREAAERFERFDALLRTWNEKMDLTAVRDGEAPDRHYLDSLTAAPLLPEGARVIDVGTGAGFPGVPLCIARPDLEMTLLDAREKRVEFLSLVVRELGLSARAVHARAEDFARAERERYDAALSRAVASLPVLAEWLLPLVRVGGRCVCWKGPSVGSEIADADRVSALLGGGPVRLEETVIPGRDWRHVLALIDKQAPTPERFPRRAGMALKRPL